MTNSFCDVTELAGTEISVEQLERMAHRYLWAVEHCKGKDVAEIGCGSGQGLGVLASVARSMEGGDYSPEVLSVAKSHYGDRVQLAVFDAQQLPFRDGSKDVLVLFEAIYYVPDAFRFVREARRVLRPGGKVLIATANKDLADFNPSPLSHRYFGAAELRELFVREGFAVELFGYLPAEKVSARQRLLRPVKKLAVDLGLMPKTMKGKKLLKRLVFGRLVPMPAELTGREVQYTQPCPIDGSGPDRSYKVLYCCATALP